MCDSLTQMSNKVTPQFLEQKCAKECNDQRHSLDDSHTISLFLTSIQIMILVQSHPMQTLLDDLRRILWHHQAHKGTMSCQGPCATDSVIRNGQLTCGKVYRRDKRRKCVLHRSRLSPPKFAGYGLSSTGSPTVIRSREGDHVEDHCI